MSVREHARRDKKAPDKHLRAGGVVKSGALPLESAAPDQTEHAQGEYRRHQRGASIEESQLGKFHQVANTPSSDRKFDSRGDPANMAPDENRAGAARMDVAAGRRVDDLLQRMRANPSAHAARRSRHHGKNRIAALRVGIERRCEKIGDTFR